jgi:hypothetical protein
VLFRGLYYHNKSAFARELVVVFNDFIPEGDGQVAPGSASLPDPVALETGAEA